MEDVKQLHRLDRTSNEFRTFVNELVLDPRNINFRRMEVYVAFLIVLVFDNLIVSFQFVGNFEVNLTRDVVTVVQLQI